MTEAKRKEKRLRSFIPFPTIGSRGCEYWNTGTLRVLTPSHTYLANIIVILTADFPTKTSCNKSMEEMLSNYGEHSHELYEGNWSL